MVAWMLLVLQIVVGVLLGLLVFAAAAWFLLKRWLRGKAAQFGRAGALLGDRAPAPARLHLQLGDPDAPDEALQDAWAQAHALGFERLADLETREGSPERVRAAWHPPTGMGLCLCQDMDEVQHRLFALGEGQRLAIRSNGPGDSLQRGNLDWRAEDEPLAAAFEALRAQVEGEALRPLQLDLLRRVFERSHAQREDALLARPPTREALEARAQPLKPALSAEDIDLAYRIERGQWLERVREAVLDHYLQVSGISAHAWQRLEPQLQVVCAGMETGELRELLVEDERDAALFAQFEAQGLGVFELYEAVSSRRAASRQTRRLRELNIPLRARLYGPLDSVAEAGGRAQLHLVSGRSSDGSEFGQAVLARDSGEALAMARAQGVEGARVLSEPVPLSELDLLALDPAAAAAAARAVREPMWLSLLRALKSNVFIWGPPLALSAWNLSQGRPFGWGDYLGFAYLALAMLVMLFLIGPMLAYNTFNRARLLKRPRTARFSLWLLARLNLTGGLKPEQLLLEQLKLEADAGRVDAALERWAAAASRMEAPEHIAGRIQLFDAAGRIEDTLQAQREAVAAAPTELARIDLAMGLAKHAQHAMEAAALVEDIEPQTLSELAAVAHAFTRGLVAQHAERDDEALRHFSAALGQAEAFKSVPMVQALMAEIQGWSTLSLRRRGDAERARALWSAVLPILSLHPSCRPLLERVEA